jgi:unsaturated chondroitin disaccharide hydrolase
VIIDELIFSFYAVLPTMNLNVTIAGNQMVNIFRRVIFFLFLVLLVSGCSKQETFQVDNELAYCATQAERTLAEMHGDSLLPRSIDHARDRWNLVGADDWTSGFWPGILWYLYESTGEEKWKDEAKRYSDILIPLSRRAAADHDLGFQVFNSFGNGYRLTHDTTYLPVILNTADALSKLYDERVGTILSWPRMTKEKGWPHHTIIDNMINLELLFWASKNGGDSSLYRIAVKHAEVTMENHFHDFTAYHVVLYDTMTGKKIRGHTHQGYQDNSMWARGQAWAIYGYTMVYRETRDPKFLAFATRVADAYLTRLPDDYIPYWDFDAPQGENQPKDASAAAITASALLELASFVDPQKMDVYTKAAERMLVSLSSSAYRSGNKNASFLLHATGHKPNGTEIDAAIIYADYYYLEALLRCKKRHMADVSMK